MIFVGVDIGKRVNEASFIGQDGREVRKHMRFPNNLSGVSSFIDVLHHQEQPCIIALEASSHYWLGMHKVASDAGFPVVVVNPLQTTAYRSTSVRKAKNDRRDSFVIADFLRIGRIVANYVPDETILKLRELTRFRFDLVDQIGDAKRKVLATLDRVFPEFPELFGDAFAKSARELLKNATTAADFVSFDLSELVSILRSNSHGHLGQARAEEIKKAAQNSLGLACLGDVALVKLRSLLAQIEFLESQVVEVEKAIGKAMEGIKEHLTDIKGIGPILAATIFAEIGDISWFSRLESLVAYAGIDPSVFESGEFIGRRQHMSKRGSPYLRRALWLAAHSARLWNKDLDEYLRRKLAEGKPYNVAMGALCHKLLSRIYVVLKENRPYEVK
jgi:transposase